jgi:hypothetical protein
MLLVVAHPLNAHHVAVVNQPVHGSHGHLDAGEDLVLIPEVLVGGHQQGAVLVAVADQFVGAAFFEELQHRGLQLATALIADVIDNQQCVAIQLLDQGWELKAGFCLLQELQQCGGRQELARLDLLEHRDRDGNGQVGLGGC